MSPSKPATSMADFLVASLGQTDILCPLCQRPNYHPTDHHLVPRCKGGTQTATLCRDCHRAVHVLFTNQELAQTYHTVDALLAHAGLAKMVRHIARQDGLVRMLRPRGLRRRRY